MAYQFIILNNIFLGQPITVSKYIKINIVGNIITLVLLWMKYYNLYVYNQNITNKINF